MPKRPKQECKQADGRRHQTSSGGRRNRHRLPRLPTDLRFEVLGLNGHELNPHLVFKQFLVSSERHITTLA